MTRTGMLREGGGTRMAGRPASVRFIVAGLAFLLVAGGWYVYTVNVAAVAGYRLRALEQEVVRLKDENARLRITEAEARSFARIEADKESLSLVEADDVRYYTETDTLARR